jgi:hypothetical protein
MHSPAAPSPSTERHLYYRERNDGLHSAFTSLASKMVEEILINAVIA